MRWVSVVNDGSIRSSDPALASNRNASSPSWNTSISFEARRNCRVELLDLPVQPAGEQVLAVGHPHLARTQVGVGDREALVERGDRQRNPHGDGERDRRRDRFARANQAVKLPTCDLPGEFRRSSSSG